MLKHLCKISTINLLLAFAAFAIIPVSAQSSSVSQQVQGTNILSFLCTHDSITFSPVNINSTEPFFQSYWTNPKSQADIETNPVTCGTGVVIVDQRYNGGFKLQVSATRYSKLGDETKTIDIGNLAIMTEQLDSNYNETSSTPSNFPATSTLVTGTQGDDIEAVFHLPFTFNYYGNSYTDVYLCSNGSINLTPGHCLKPSSPLSDVFTDTPARILGYYKDLTTAQNPDDGIYVYEDTDTVTFRWKAAPLDDTSHLAEFTIIITNNGSNDTITFNYGDARFAPYLTDTGASPAIGVTNGGTVPDGELPSSVYTESVFSETQNITNLINTKVYFTPSGFDFKEVKKPGTPSAAIDPLLYNQYYNFTPSANPAISQEIDIINGSSPSTGGRIGIYAVYPSFRLSIPESTEDGTYQNEITYTVTDSTS